jgi:hypothetical protein
MHVQRPTALAVLLFTIAGAACARDPLPEGARSAGEWAELLDGGALAWRGYRQDTLPAGWRFDSISDELTRVGSGGDIVTKAEWEDFELRLEWRISAGGNSGIFYRATEATDVIYMNATEMQILDNAGHRDGGSPLTSTGANYGLYPPTEDASRPVGEWNEARIVAIGPRVRHYLNGKLVVDYEMWSPEWEEKVKASKFAQWPAYGRAARGHIGLQDHGDTVSFRRIRVRELTR